MRICIVSPFAFGSNIAPRLKLASLLAERGHKIYFFTPKTPYVVSRHMKEPVKLVNPPSNVSMQYINNLYLFPNLAYPFVNPITETFHLSNIIKNEGIQLIHFYQPEFLTTLPLVALKRMYRIPVVLTINGIPGYGWKYGNKWVDIIGKIYTKLFLYSLIRKSDYLLLYSSKLEIILKQMGFSNIPCKFIPESIDTSKFIPRKAQREILRNKYALPQNSLIIIFSGRLVPVKRLDVLIGAINKISNDLPQAFLLIVGDGPSREELAKLAKHYFLNQFKITGFMSQEEVSELYSCSDIFALLSHGEGISTSLLEACSSGLPCIVSDVGANADVVKDGYNGFVLKNISVEEVASAILALYPNINEMGNNSRKQIVNEFNWATIVDKYEYLYGELIRLH